MLSKHALAGSLLALGAVALTACPSSNPADAGTDASPNDVQRMGETGAPDTGADVTQPDGSLTDNGPGPTDIGPDTGVDAGPVDTGVLDAGPQDGGGGGTCVITPAVAGHTAMMATAGWASRDLSGGMLMYGCASGQAASACLSTVPLASDGDIGSLVSAIPSAHLRVMYRSTGSSSYWTRISADGRFVARGTHVHDFVRSVEVETGPPAEYDPAFFPDDSRFMYQPNALSCPLSVLTTGSPTRIAFNEMGCSRVGSVGLYEHLAVSLNGTDYWATSAGAAAWDDGGHHATLQDPPPNMPWNAGAETTLSLLANTGTTFSTVSTVSIPTPHQGDGVISPSSTMLMTRLADSGGNHQIAYVLYSLNAARVGNAVTQSITEIGRYCQTGAKPAFSLDERYVAMHHYVTADDAVDLGFTGPSDPHFAPYLTQGASNVYLLNLATGERTRVTNMGPGQYALYPAFRADGWMYFTVRTLGTTTEFIVASDSAIVMR